MNTKKDVRRKKVLVVLLILLLTAAATIVWQINSLRTNDIISGDMFPGIGGAAEGHLPKMTETEIMQQLQREADRSKFSFKINSRPIFENGAKEGTLQIENPSHNIYPFVVEIFLNETGEKIYDSGGILPNHHIDRAKLTKVLPKGSHTAIAYIRVYDPKTNKYAGQSAAELTLIINN